MARTAEQYDEVIAACKAVFQDKMTDYGSAWRILRPTSLTDQIYIKANRIRSITEKGQSRVNEGIWPEFIGIVNYSVMAMIQLELGPAEDTQMEKNRVLRLYEKYFSMARSLMENKNHDYGEAWRNMRITSLNDIILMKLLRIKQIEDNEGKTTVSEGLDANYADIINYAVFALIKLMEQKQEETSQA
jgi:transcription initiation factor TFIIIB Brf1 subunit/transcription initiation factor TFIIB